MSIFRKPVAYHARNRLHSYASRSDQHVDSPRTLRVKRFVVEADSESGFEPLQHTTIRFERDDLDDRNFSQII